MARIGLVQTGRVGDIIIALPIAAAFAEQGHEVLWPVNSAYLSFLPDAAPWVKFIPVTLKTPDTWGKEELFEIPHAELVARRCDAIHVLYSALRSENGPLPGAVQNERLAQFLKFDEYKYAVTGIPFSEKWNLKLKRDLAREARFFDSLRITRPFICVHRIGSNFTADIAIPEEWKTEFQMVEIDGPGTPFDWITTLERASKLLMIDSSFANLVEQLNLPNEKYMLLRSPGLLTPVYRNGWQFL
jgi:hypothetical protein